MVWWIYLWDTLFGRQFLLVIEQIAPSGVKQEILFGLMRERERERANKLPEQDGLEEIEREWGKNECST